VVRLGFAFVAVLYISCAYSLLFACTEFTQAGLVRLRKRTDQLVDDINAITEQNLQQQRTRKQVHDDYMEGTSQLLFHTPYMLL
jgi:hypothetical protein